MGRVDHFEISKETREVWVKDDFGINVMQECAMQDMRDLEEELLKIGSFYIGKHEHLVNTECEKAYPHVDRITLLEDLLDKELDFQFEKVHIVQAYMETYEHISDPLE